MQPKRNDPETTAAIMDADFAFLPLFLRVAKYTVSMSTETLHDTLPLHERIGSAMTDKDLNRRRFLETAGAVATAGSLAAAKPASVAEVALRMAGKSK